MSIDGNKDRKYIKNFIKNMRANDDLKFRDYMSENTPSLDYTVEITKPESLGGGTIKTFLQIGDDLFFNFIR